MRMNFGKKYWFITALSILLMRGIQCTPESRSEASQTPDLIRSNPGTDGVELSVEFSKGDAHNHPSFAIWLEDMEGNFIETLFVTRYVATGTYGHGELEPGKWKAEPGPAVRPATLPYWLHKRGQKSGRVPDLPSPDNPAPDAISGATPAADFKLKTNSTSQLPTRFRLLMEINQPWDANQFWTNSRYPQDADYITSLQPALVYAVTIDQDSPVAEYFLNPIGHSHYSGKDGRLYTDLSSFSTALDIVRQVVIKVNPR